MKQSDKVQHIAESILPQFIPKQLGETALTFHFTLPPNNNYKVWFEKVGSEWIFKKYEEDDAVTR